MEGWRDIAGSGSDVDEVNNIVVSKSQEIQSSFLSPPLYDYQLLSSLRWRWRLVWVVMGVVQGLCDLVGILM